jgi:hypothetical protein
MEYPQLNVHKETINYLDGSEQALADIVSSEHFNEFTSWQNRQDWAQYYHLSPLRKNVLSWINFSSRPLRILELGAGCGAITSYLVTLHKSEVIAVEGNVKRAKIIQSRCKNAANLTIEACTLNAYTPEKKFDLITLIGVLEYAGKYETVHHPFLTLLKRTEGWLSENGMVICAIENQLGHKYIAGAPEDHYGIRYEGINNYPHNNGVRTFTKTTLSKLFSSAGLTAQQWYYPYPDYKLPSVIYSDRALTLPEFDFIALMDVPPEPNENRNPTLCERSLLSLVQSEGVAASFMNSFILVASRENNEEFLDNNRGMLAIKSNVKFRAPSYQTYTIFKQNGDEIEVIKRKVFPDSKQPNCDIKLYVKGRPEPYYYSKTSIFEKTVDAILNNSYSEAFETLLTWVKKIDSMAHPMQVAEREQYEIAMKKNIGQVLYFENLEEAWVSGEFIDLVPLNILIPKTKSFSFDEIVLIDMEWQVPFAIPLQLVFDRGITLLVDKMYKIIKPHKIAVDETTLLPAGLYELFKEFSLFKTQNRNDLSLFESWFQHTIMQKSETFPSLNQFIEKVVSLVEKGMNRHAVSYYDMYRSKFSVMPEMHKFDAIISSIRSKL